MRVFTKYNLNHLRSKTGEPIQNIISKKLHLKAFEQIIFIISHHRPVAARHVAPEHTHPRQLLIPRCRRRRRGGSEQDSLRGEEADEAAAGHGGFVCDGQGGGLVTWREVWMVRGCNKL